MVPAGLATPPPFPPGDVRIASTHSLEPPLAKLDIKVPVEDIVSVVREEEAERITQIVRASDRAATPSKPTLHLPEQDAATSPSLPPEILDLIVDHLCDEPTALKVCSAASKSWVQRTRKHLFASVEFNEVRSTIVSWKEDFPDPSNSPAHHTRSLKIIGLSAFMTTGTDVRAWIHSFRHLVKLTVCTFGWKDDRVSFILFRGLSPTLKSLSLYCSSAPFPEIFNLISSFPLLGDLELKRGDRWRNIDGRDIPSIPSKPTASSDLEGDYRPIGRGPLCLPDRSRLSRIIISRPVEDAKTVMDLVSKCSDTLESLCVEYVPFGRDRFRVPHPLDLSRAPKLKDVEFVAGYTGIQWITTTLQATIPKHLRQISIYSYGTRFVAGETGREWQDLDRILVKLWTSYSILPKIVCCDRLQMFAPNLLPELTSRGISPEFRSYWKK